MTTWQHIAKNLDWVIHHFHLEPALVLTLGITTFSLLFVVFFRPPICAYSLEFPAGLIDEDEDPVAAGLRELKEETGRVVIEVTYRGEKAITNFIS